MQARGARLFLVYLAYGCMYVCRVYVPTCIDVSGRMRSRAYIHPLFSMYAKGLGGRVLIVGTAGVFVHGGCTTSIAVLCLGRWSSVFVVK